MFELIVLILALCFGIPCAYLLINISTGRYKPGSMYITPEGMSLKHCISQDKEEDN